LNDVNFLFKSLKKEDVRKRFWEVEIDEDDLTKAKKKGLRLLRKEIKKRLERVLVPPSYKLFQDGRQTPPYGNIIFYAQHSTATCCRKCVEEWYNINRNTYLKKQILNYFCTLILLYIKKRAPMITEDGEQSLEK